MNNTTDQSKFTEASVRIAHQKARNDAYWGIRKQGEIVYKALKYLTEYELIIARQSIKKTENTVKDPNLTINGISPKVWYNLLMDELNYRIYRESVMVHSILEALEVSYINCSNTGKTYSQALYSENYIPRKQLLLTKTN